jgi:hypothetical protein
MVERRINLNLTPLPAVILLSALMMLLPILVSGQEQQAQKWLTFDRTNYGFKIGYPAYPDLVIRERANSVIFQKLGNSPDIHDEIIISVNIIKKSKGNENNNNNNNSENNGNLNQFVNNLVNNIPSSYKVLEFEKNATLSGLPAYRLMIISLQGNKELSIFTSKESTIYSIGYSVAQSNDFDKFLPVAQKMIDSFQITKENK